MRDGPMKKAARAKSDERFHENAGMRGAHAVHSEAMRMPSANHSQLPSQMQCNHCSLFCETSLTNFVARRKNTPLASEHLDAHQHYPLHVPMLERTSQTLCQSR